MHKVYVKTPNAVSAIGTCAQVSEWLENGFEVGLPVAFTPLTLRAALDSVGETDNCVCVVGSFSQLRAYVRLCLQSGHTLADVRAYFYI